jgi:hypothetical protein
MHSEQELLASVSFCYGGGSNTLVLAWACLMLMASSWLPSSLIDQGCLRCRLAG